MNQWQPQRKCAGCMQVKPQIDMLRIVRQPDGTVSIDAGGRADGRGVYLCSAACVDTAWKKKRLSRNLRCDVPFEIYEEIKQKFNRSEEASKSN